MNDFVTGRMIRKRTSSVCLMALATAVVGIMLVVRVGAQTPRPTVPRTIDGKPDFSGIWQAATPEANWNLQAHAAQPGPPQYGALFAEPPGLGVVEGNDIPYQPWAAAKKNQNFEQRYALDPEAKCYMPGVPRATYMPFPFQIVQGNNKLVISYEFANATRIVNLGEPKPSPVDSWMGWSNGRFEGDTLVIDVTGQREDTWLDRAGNFHSDELHVVERYTLESANLVRYQATIEDPKVFTRPWAIAVPLNRRPEKNAQLLEFHCVPFAEEMMYGHLTKPKGN